MDFFEKLGITPYINAHDTYTIYGGSRMSGQTLEAMAEASRHFVDIEEMQRTLGEKIAGMTRNEGAYLTNGAAGGLLLAACLCMAQGSMYRYTRLPNTAGMPNEIIMMRAQRNAYDAAVRGSGAVIVEIGDADETLDYDLEGSINERTAAVFYFVSSLFERGSMPLAEVIRIAHDRNIPVVVDAAAQLPPAENLWKFTGMGADLVLFSGGKTLRGPQDSGLMLGRKDLIADAIRFGAPVHGICRSSKTSREAMAGLYAALAQYLALDPATEAARLARINGLLAQTMERGGLRVVMNPQGPVGQDYARPFGYCDRPGQAEAIAAAMRAQHTYIGLEQRHNAIYFSALNLDDQEAETVCWQLSEALKV